MGRRIAASYGDGGYDTTCYSSDPGGACSSSNLPMSITKTHGVNGSSAIKTTITPNGLGKDVRSVLISDPNCPTGSNVDTSYDADNRVSIKSNPYCSTSDVTYGTAATTYDGLSRVIRVSRSPDGSYVTSQYSGRAVSRTDAGNGTAGISIISQTDALGRLTSLCEVSGTTQKGSSNTPSSCGLDLSGSGFLTTYSYDALGNVSGASQGGIGRSFTYDSLSRLVRGSNPESGATSYTYDAASNLISKTDAKNTIVSYAYDSSNRLISKLYSDGTSSACFTYDSGATNGMGRLTAEWTQAGSCAATPPANPITERILAAYDLMGRVVSDEQCQTPGSCNSLYTVSHAYDLAGDESSITNGLSGSSSMAFTSSYDAAGRLAILQAPQQANSGSLIPLVSGVKYNPGGGMTDAQVGPGIVQHRDYDDLFRPIDEIDTSPTSPGTAAVQITGAEQYSEYSVGTITFQGPFGGVDQSTTVNGSAYYDGGLFLISVNGAGPIQLTYNQNSTPTTLAAATANYFSCSNGPVQAVSAGAVVYLFSCTQSQNTGYSLSAKNDGNDNHFASPSFTVTTSGNQMTQVAEQSYTPTNPPIGTVQFVGTEQHTTQNGTTTYDAGVIGMQFFSVPQNSSPKLSVSLPWGQGSTPQTLASQMTTLFPSCASGGLIAATASGAGVTLTSCSSTNYVMFMYMSDNNSSVPSFTVDTGQYVVGGTANVADSGTASLSVNGSVVASANYASGATPAGLVSSLVKANASGSTVNLSASNADPTYLLISTKGGGTGQNYTYTLSISYNSSQFSQPSFSSPNSSGNLQGGKSQPLYNWAISNYAPDGDVLSVKDSVLGTWIHTYDDLNRLTSSKASAGTFSGQQLTWDYDRYGNRWDQLLSGTGSAVQTQLTFSGNNNRMDSYSYDAAGNLLSDNTTQYTYDAENRIATINGHAAYLYDATGARVAKLTSGGALSAVYLLDTAGRQLTELDGSGHWQHSNVFTSGGRLVATYEAATADYHYHMTDWLGTKRVQTNGAGIQEETCTSYPFGDSLQCSGASDASEQHFTGKERDPESGLDYFGARYLSSNLGRFMTPDWASTPASVPYANFGDPQSLNLYTYVRNNPNTGIDTDGHAFETWPTHDGYGGGIQQQNDYTVCNADCSTWNADQDDNLSPGVTDGGSGDSAPPTPQGAQQQNSNLSPIDKVAMKAEAGALKLTRKALAGGHSAEYGGLILRKNADGSLSSTAPINNGETSTDYSSISVPRGYTVVGRYHTHPSTGCCESEGPSTRDVYNLRTPETASQIGYVGSAFTGQVRRYTHLESVTGIYDTHTYGTVIGTIP